MAFRSRNNSVITLKGCVLVLLFAALACSLVLARKTVGQKRNPKPSTKPAPTPDSNVQRLGSPPPIPILRRKTEEDLKPGDVISIETTEVMLPVTVRDANGRLVADLTRKDFRVFEEGNEQPLTDFALRKVPVEVILMVDASSSVAANIEDFRGAVEKFAAQLNPDDRLSLIKFDDRVELLQDWTTSQFQLRRALARIKPGMFTRFNDALMLAAREQFGSGRALQSRRAIIVLSDGIDSGRGDTTYEAALQSLLEAQATVYVVSNTQISRLKKRAELDSLLGGSELAVKFNQLRIDDLREGLRALDQSEQRLAQLSEMTGGRLYTPRSFSDLDDVYHQVAEELRTQYAIYYIPLNKTRDGSFRRVNVKTTNGAYQTSTRIGYFVPRS
jgi:Ca-activated chloride channel homolog